MGNKFEEYGFSDEVVSRARLDSSQTLEEAINTITIGETHFYRHPEQFDILREWARKKINKINVLIAPCATGEEAYTTAAVLLEENKTHYIDAIDINSKFIERAKIAKYSEWSVSRAQRPAPWIIKLDNKEYTVQDRIKTHINFRQQNILTLQYQIYDIIFCRNLLIYFHEKAINEVYMKLSSMLADDGMLFIAASDPRPTTPVPLKFITYNGTTFAIKGKEKTLSEIKPVAEKITPKSKRMVIKPRSVHKPIITPKTVTETSQPVAISEHVYEIGKILVAGLEALNKEDYDTALVELRKCNYFHQGEEPYILTMLALAHQKKGLKSTGYYDKAYSILQTMEEDKIVNFTDDVTVYELRKFIEIMC